VVRRSPACGVTLSIDAFCSVRFANREGSSMRSDARSSGNAEQKLQRTHCDETQIGF
jgi:hypothetical protein